MNYTEFQNEVKNIRKELFAEFDLADALDHVDQYAEGQQSVIYYAQSWELVNMIREADYTLFAEAELMWEENFEPSVDLNTTMSNMAYCIWTIAINNALYYR